MHHIKVFPTYKFSVNVCHSLPSPPPTHEQKILDSIQMRERFKYGKKYECKTSHKKKRV